MAYKDNNVAYGFGQMGSIHVAGTTYCTSNEVNAQGMQDNNAVFIAISFLEDTVFDSSNTEGLIAEDGRLFPSSNGKSADIDSDAGVATDSETFPKGMTIYGRWTGFKLSSGRVIAYIGY